jgi:hypothetical protein
VLGLTAALAAGTPPDQRDEPAAGSVPAFVAGQVMYARVNEQADRWELFVEPENGLPLTAARIRVPGTNTPAPLLLSGDGQYAVYVDDATGRLIHTGLASGSTHDLSGPLPGGSVPEPMISHDGRYVSLTTDTGTELVDTRAGTRIRMPGIRRVLGLGSGGLIGTTGRRALYAAPDTELRTLGLDGEVRTRVPFDPTLRPLVSPDGRVLTIVPHDEVLTMDPRTGRITGRKRLAVPGYYSVPLTLGWADDGRLLVRIEPKDDDQAHLHLVDTATGTSTPLELDLPSDAISGRLA